MKFEGLYKIKWWKYATGSIPIICLLILILLDVIALSSFDSGLPIAILLVFVAVSIFWWWWAIERIITLSKLLGITEAKLLYVRQEIVEIRRETDLLLSENKKK